MKETPAVKRFESSTGVIIYRIPMNVFPGFIGYSFLLLGAGVPTLIDCGSGFGTSTDDWFAGFQSIQDDFDEKITPKDIERIIISHGHIDHFGGITKILEEIGRAHV